METFNFPKTVYATIFLAICYRIIVAIYNIYLHPLSAFPGPRLWAASRLPFMINLWQGRLPYRVRELHDTYGTVVRTGPNELSFTAIGAWKDIYAKRESSRPHQWQGKLPGVDADTLISSLAPDHARFRNAFSSAFSHKALRSQEGLISTKIDKLIQILREERANKETSEPVRLAEWVNFVTFDIMGEIGWGASFDCLETGAYHPWVLAVLWYKGLLFGVTLKLYPSLGAVVAAFTPRAAEDGVKMVVETSRRNVEERLKKTDEHTDLISAVNAFNRTNPSKQISKDELISNSSTIIIAGSDPLASVAAGALTYLIHHPEVMHRLETEIRSRFWTEAEITLDTVQDLPYLRIVILEALRMCPPVPDSMRRIVPSHGSTVAGYFVPGDTTIGISPFAAFRDKDIYESPDSFKPERWGDRTIRLEDQMGFYPFGYGPRSCAGQALALGELRLLLTRLIWNFDIRDTERGTVRPWLSQKIYWTWQRDALEVSLGEVGVRK